MALEEKLPCGQAPSQYGDVFYFAHQRVPVVEYSIGRLEGERLEIRRRAIGDLCIGRGGHEVLRKGRKGPVDHSRTDEE